LLMIILALSILIASSFCTHNSAVLFIAMHNSRTSRIKHYYSFSNWYFYCVNSKVNKLTNCYVMLAFSTKHLLLFSSLFSPTSRASIASLSFSSLLFYNLYVREIALNSIMRNRRMHFAGWKFLISRINFASPKCNDYYSFFIPKEVTHSMLFCVYSVYGFPLLSHVLVHKKYWANSLNYDK
jgi:hypothetical protein